LPIDPTLEAFPKNRLPLDQITRDALVTEPPLLRAYLSMGAVICSEPSWDPDFNTADFLIFLDLTKVNPRYARHFGLADAAATP
jgi:putative hemolysin